MGTYVPNTSAEQMHMLESCGFSSFEEMYADKRDRHKEPYIKYLAHRIMRRFPSLRAEPEDLTARISAKKESDRKKHFAAFLDRQKKEIFAAEKKLLRRVRRKKKEKVEP